MVAEEPPDATGHCRMVVGVPLACRRRHSMITNRCIERWPEPDRAEWYSKERN